MADVFGAELQQPSRSASYNSADNTQVSGLASVANFGANVASIFKDVQAAKTDAARIAIAQQEQEYKMQQRLQAERDEAEKSEISLSMAELSDIARQAQQGTSTSQSKLELGMQPLYTELVKKYPSQLEFINQQFKDTVGFMPAESIIARRLHNEARAEQRAEADRNRMLSFALQNDLGVFNTNGSIDEAKTINNIKDMQDAKEAISTANALYENPNASVEMKESAMSFTVASAVTIGRNTLEAALTNGSIKEKGAAGIFNDIRKGFFNAFEDKALAARSWNIFNQQLDISGTLKRAEESNEAPLKYLANNMKMQRLLAEEKLSQEAPHLYALGNINGGLEFVMQSALGETGSYNRAKILQELSAFTNSIQSFKKGVTTPVSMSPNVALQAGQFMEKTLRDSTAKPDDAIAVATSFMNSAQFATVDDMRNDVKGIQQQLNNSTYAISKLDNSYWNKLNKIQTSYPELYQQSLDTVKKVGIAALANAANKLNIEGNGAIRFNKETESYEYLKPDSSSELGYSYKRVSSIKGLMGSLAQTLSFLTVPMDTYHNSELQKTIKDYNRIVDTLKRAGVSDEEMSQGVAMLLQSNAGVKNPRVNLQGQLVDKEQPITAAPVSSQSE